MATSGHESNFWGMVYGVLGTGLVALVGGVIRGGISRAKLEQRMQAIEVSVEQRFEQVVDGMRDRQEHTDRRHEKLDAQLAGIYEILHEQTKTLSELAGYVAGRFDSDQHDWRDGNG
jgi:hypothetical protein